jgi:hypothetical protein
MLVFPYEDFNASVPSHTVTYCTVNTYLCVISAFFLHTVVSGLVIRDTVTADILNCIVHICICTNCVEHNENCPNSF